MGFISFWQKFMNKFKLFYLISVLVVLLSLNSCGLYKRSDVKDTPVNVEERVKKNIQEGRGVRFGRGATRGGDFDFASSNPLWRASIEIFDFVPLTNASYSGGILITDWFSSESNESESTRDLKITVKFLTNEIRADAIDITVFEKICKSQDCKTKRIKSKLQKEIKLAILKKATLMEKEGFKKYYEKTGKNRAKTLDKKK
tara:strand:- start:1433 stop:2035 length:603 start_codon:yes stop_codon:yes gene_type:complete